MGRAFLAAGVAAAVISAAPAAASAVQVVSRAPGGQPGNGGSLFPLVSGDGRFVAYSSTASDLVSRDPNGDSDVFLRNLRSGRTLQVSGAPGGRPPNGDSYPLGISPHGRYVSFWSDASNLVAADRNGTWDVFVRDTRTGRIRLVDRNNGGVVANQGAWAGTVVDSGRLAVFQSWSPSLAHTGGFSQIFIRDLATGHTWAISRAAGGALGNNESELEAVSPDGRFVVYRTLASNLVAGDTNGTMDALVYDRASGRTTRADVSSAGAQAPAGATGAAAISDDGRLVVFESLSRGLVPGAAGGLYAHDMRSGRTWRLDPTTGAFALAGDGSAVVVSTAIGNGGGLAQIGVASGLRTALPVASADGRLLQPSLSTAGTVLSFFSTATDLPAGAAGGLGQVYALRFSAGS